MIEVVRVAGVATVQDGGRPGHMHEGVPPGGALVPELMARANAAAGNTWGEAAIELFGAVTLAARAPVLLATDAGDVHALREGDTRALAGRQGRVGYVGVRGGVEVPRVLGGRGTLVAAGLGGHEGRPLRRGDRLAVGAARVEVVSMLTIPPPPSPPLPPEPDPAAPISVVLGPDADRFDATAVETLLSSTFFVGARSDRVGTRLDGPRLAPSADATQASAPMVRGAIQVPPSGQPIVLGPDHPTTGGYPVLATVVRACLGSLAARSTGAPVRFALRAGHAGAGGLGRGD